MIHSVFNPNIMIIYYIGVQLDPSISELKNTSTHVYKHLMKCINNDNNLSIKIEAIVRNVDNLRIKEALLIAKLHP